ncbi:flagellar hook-basal body complex protein [Primorskyibacter sp. S87]|uniref:flagellar hook-basal body complex protein n=1 Tax=Primorskyibacter sp. S87 TaxID=3415126 RepID=UPI003C7978FA
MEASTYTTLSRQSALLKEIRVVANNVANASTTGYRAEGLVFSEFVKSAPDHSSLSMTRADVRNTSSAQGQLTQTNGVFDLAIEGDGYFMVDTDRGPRLTRAGSFSPNSDGDLVNMDGHPVLDAGGARIFVPPDVANIFIAPDGTLSADGRSISQIGLFLPTEPARVVREGGVLFQAEGEVETIDTGTVLQGFLEGSNVNPMAQMVRLVEVQRAYEMGQSFLKSEDERIRNAVKTLVR